MQRFDEPVFGFEDFLNGDREIIQRGLVEEVRSNQPYVTVGGDTLAKSPALQLARGKVYALSLDASRRFRALTPGVEIEAGSGHTTVAYSIRFDGTENETTMIEIDQRGGSIWGQALITLPDGSNSPIATHLGPCEPAA